MVMPTKRPSDSTLPSLFKWAICVTLATVSAYGSAQVTPLAPRWAGDAPAPTETYQAGLERHHIALNEQALIDALKNPDGEVRSLAAAQLAVMDDHPALKYITNAFQNERDPQVQVNLAGAATWLGSRSGLQQLEQMCQDINVPSLVRLDAARYVSNQRSAACFPAIQDIAQRDQDPNVRVQAVSAAAIYRGQSDAAQAVAVYALKDLDPSVRIAATDALRFLKATGATGAINQALQVEGDETAREHLRKALREFSSK